MGGFSPVWMTIVVVVVVDRPRYAFVHPLSYTILFVTGDIISLVVQAIGGGQASAAETLEEANKGGYVMVSLRPVSLSTLSCIMSCGAELTAGNRDRALFVNSSEESPPS